MKEALNGLPDKFFRILEADEAQEFEQWARDNFDPEKTIDGCWHPVVRAEWRRLARECA